MNFILKMEKLPLDYVSSISKESLLRDPVMAVSRFDSRGCCHRTRFTSINGDGKFQKSRSLSGGT